MENVPIATTLNFVKWWATLKGNGKSFVLLACVLIASAAVNVYQYGEISQTQDEKSALEKEALTYAKDCEMRVSIVTIKERNRSDSIRAEDFKKFETERQVFFETRTPVVINRNEKIKKELK